ncbi:MAG: dephospho-CoA kinase [Pseudomonadota bacterium]
MIIVGLTGSIGMGKSTAATRFRHHGIPVCDADAEVHKLYAGKAAPLIEEAFPGTTVDGVVDRQKLGAELLKDPGGFKTLEAIVHPLVREAERKFLQDAQTAGHQIAVLEIPLLFETGADALVDKTVVVSAGPDEQSRRVLERPGMTVEKLESIIARQQPDDQKRAKADFLVDSSGPVTDSAAQVDDILMQLKDAANQCDQAQAYHRHWSGA